MPVLDKRDTANRCLYNAPGVDESKETSPGVQRTHSPRVESRKLVFGACLIGYQNQAAARESRGTPGSSFGAGSELIASDPRAAEREQEIVFCLLSGCTCNTAGRYGEEREAGGK